MTTKTVPLPGAPPYASNDLATKSLLGKGVTGAVYSASSEYNERMRRATGGVWGSEFAVKVQLKNIPEAFQFFKEELDIYERLDGAMHVVPQLAWRVEVLDTDGTYYYRSDDTSDYGEEMTPREGLNYLSSSERVQEMTQTFPLFHGELGQLIDSPWHAQQSPREKLRMCYQVAFGMFEVHRRGVVHYDLHMGNILYRLEPGRCYLAIHDFGHAMPRTQVSFDMDIKRLGGVMSKICVDVFIKWDLQYGPLNEVKRVYGLKMYSLVYKCLQARINTWEVLEMLADILRTH